HSIAAWHTAAWSACPAVRRAAAGRRTGRRAVAACRHSSLGRSCRAADGINTSRQSISAAADPDKVDVLDYRVMAGPSSFHFTFAVDDPIRCPNDLHDVVKDPVILLGVQHLERSWKVGAPDESKMRRQNLSLIPWVPDDNRIVYHHRLPGRWIDRRVRIGIVT